MATVRVDTRNLEWKNNNVGSKLLSAMGWTDGTKVGKRARMNMTTAEQENPSDNTSAAAATAAAASSEGLWITKRQDGLGIGAEGNALREASSRYNHVGDFASVLASLQQQQQSDTTTSSKKKRKRDKETTKLDIEKEASIRSVATNRITNAKVRKAKFASKSEDDMKCIFAGAAPVLPDNDTAIETTTTTAAAISKPKKKKDKKNKKEKKNKEKKSSSKKKSKRTDP